MRLASSPPLRAALLWFAILLGTVLVLLDVRASTEKAHVILVLLLVILGGSSAGGRILGVSLAVASFLAFNWFFVPPYSTLFVAHPPDWLVLVAFLVTGIVAAQLLYMAQREARTSEVLRQSQQMKDALLASVSHDLRTPLTTIKALAHDLSVLGDERSEIIEQEADRLNRSVADLLDLSRLNGGALRLRIELNAVDDLLGAVMQRVEPAMGSQRLRVSLPPDDPLLLGSFDFVHTLRILANLVENAAKYSPPDAAIDVRASRDDGTLVIQVSDRGPGVAATEVSRMFESFYRAPGVPPDVGGTGLGLSIARRLAEAQAGTLTYEDREGGGSTFVLRLPAADFDDRESRSAP